MDDNLCTWKHLLDSSIASIRQTCILIHMLLRTSHGPKESVGSLVAHLYPAHIYPSLFNSSQHVAGMVCQRMFHLQVFHLLPCSRDILLSWISPPVAIVEIYHDSHSPLLGSKRHLHHIILVTQSGLGIDPNTQTNGIESQFVHQFRALTRLPFGIAQLYPASLKIRSATNVCPQPES